MFSEITSLLAPVGRLFLEALGADQMPCMVDQDYWAS